MERNTSKHSEFLNIKVELKPQIFLLRITLEKYIWKASQFTKKFIVGCKNNFVTILEKWDFADNTRLEAQN